MATKEQKQNKIFAEKLLLVKGVNYDEWLDEKHQDVIQSSQSLIIEALESKLNKSSFNDSDSINNGSNQNNSY